MRARLQRTWFLIGMTAAIGGGFVFHVVQLIGDSLLAHWLVKHRTPERSLTPESNA